MSWWDNLKSTLPVNAGFDPVAMGLEPLMQGGYTPASAETGEVSSPGVQTGWYKYLGDRRQQQYDMQGNPTRIFTNPGLGEQTMGAVKQMAPLALAALSAGALGAFNGAGAIGTAAAPYVGEGALSGIIPGVAESVVPGAVAGGTGLATALTGAGGAAAPLAAGAAGAGLSSLLVPGAIIGSSLLGANAATKAAETQADAQTQANKLLYDQYQQQRKDLQPFVTAGAGAQNQLLTYLGLPGGTPGAGFGKYAGDFGVNDMVTDPGYAFRFSEGQKALDRQAAARGGLISGGALKAATRYGQDMGSQEYQNAYNRYQTNRQNQLAPLFSLTGSGQASAAGQSAASGNYATQAAGGLTNVGAANAAGTVGATNALTAGLGSYLNYSSNQDMVNALTRRTGYGVT